MTKLDIKNSIKELAGAIEAVGLDTEKWLREEYVFKNLRNVANDKEKLKRMIICAGEWSLRGANKREEYRRHLFDKIKWNSSDKELYDIIMRAPFAGLSKNRIMNFFRLIRKLLGTENPTDTLNEKLKRPDYFYKEIVELLESGNYKNVGKFTIRAFFKILHLQGEYEFDKILPVPLGQNVERAIKELTGYSGSRKAFDELAQSIHRKFASLSGTDIYVINSGLWEFGSFELI